MKYRIVMRTNFYYIQSTFYYIQSRPAFWPFWSTDDIPFGTFLAAQDAVENYNKRLSFGNRSK